MHEMQGTAGQGAQETWLACLLSGCQYAVTLRLPFTHTSLSKPTSFMVHTGQA